ncbi:hypothetical protein PspLS_01115 [Pyricularia sp. CBS 133598]|nr:hypothetical protein PspLS_01115 [Pyricularia sp. CBS 133598]
MFQILEQIEYTPATRPPWLTNLERTTIFQIKFDHLKQTRIIVVRSVLQKAWPASRSMAQITNMLRTVFPPPTTQELQGGLFRPGFRTLVGAKPANMMAFFNGDTQRNKFYGLSLLSMQIVACMK